MIKEIKEVLRTEAQGILDLADRVDSTFENMVEAVFACKGRLVVAGIGKSGLVGRKIVATLISTGTHAIFLHPVEAMHGDLGVVGAGDVFLALSNSGETEELNILLPSIRHMGCPIIALTGNPGSTLGREADIVVNVGVAKEACPLGLAPTTSTTVLLAAGDALAVALIHKRQFKSSDFRRFHPGGALGQRLASRVADLMLTDNLPKVVIETSFSEVLAVMDRISLGAVMVTDGQDRLVGILTDGDVRHLAASGELEKGSLEAVMTINPRCVTPEAPVYDALNTMEEYQITVLPVVNAEGVLMGMLHLHDILGKGAFQFNARP
ncbi:KpsF/GutQ family sugar-phosphate isomerase [Desulfobotulus sp. H1]|uniref:KpsF/GutQ family sugar-phosphate isomerase n=1 Tax=Desulfobotulus pelophilus TaxID=2823377 RepID=A0ABT3N529_9BACT|nr:KpsF/GutQ family sugar-phosphate isomerase [Desulfobotulus pelophilus]MCW7752570.1 KpsF/GutQ family sugar-phosphate isomerase [Desulfobotulus pelophilus]